MSMTTEPAAAKAGEPLDPSAILLLQLIDGGVIQVVRTAQDNGILTRFEVLDLPELAKYQSWSRLGTWIASAGRNEYVNLEFDSDWYRLINAGGKLTLTRKGKDAIKAAWPEFTGDPSADTCRMQVCQLREGNIVYSSDGQRRFQVSEIYLDAAERTAILRSEQYGAVYEQDSFSWIDVERGSVLPGQEHLAR